MANKEKTETAAAAAPETVKVKVVRQPVNEGGVFYRKGDTFDVTPDRFEALGELVVPVTTK